MTPRRPNFLRFAGALLALAAVQAASAQQDPLAGSDPPPDVTAVLQGDVRSAFRMAFPGIERTGALPPDVAAAAEEVERTLRGDLGASGVFELQGPEELSVLRLVGDPARDFEQYRSLGNELLLEAVVRAEGNRLVLEGKVFDLPSGRAVLGKRYRGTPSVARRIAHTFADEIILAFSGRRGVALTSIAFHSDRSGDKEIYLMDYDGANQRPITAHKSISLAPDWSSTGDAIAYVSYYTRVPGIYLVDVASGRKTPAMTKGNLNISPSFSPDGRQLVFARRVGGGNIEIFTCNRDGSGLRQLTHHSAIDTNPAWSPTGREIAFTSNRTGKPNIFVMDAEGTNLRRVSFEGDYNDGAAWHPEGVRIAYASRRQGTFDIVLSDIVLQKTFALTTGPSQDESPSYSPDGLKLAFASRRGDATQIWTMAANGSGRRQLTRQGSNFAPAWSGYPKTP